jgi:hypothetical protein
VREGAPVETTTHSEGNMRKKNSEPRFPVPGIVGPLLSATAIQNVAQLQQKAAEGMLGANRNMRPVMRRRKK